LKFYDLFSSVVEVFIIFAIRYQKAQVAELVDALVSKTSSFQGVPVRSRPWVQEAVIIDSLYFYIYYVYSISSTLRNYIYVGMTNNIERRLEQHNRGYNRSTKPYKPYKPFILFYGEEHPNSKLARGREKYLKTASGKRYLRL
jgi:putative endonuclease